jgi:hypothetical protein
MLSSRQRRIMAVYVSLCACVCVCECECSRGWSNNVTCSSQRLCLWRRILIESIYSLWLRRGHRGWSLLRFAGIDRAMDSCWFVDDSSAGARETTPWAGKWLALPTAALWFLRDFPCVGAWKWNPSFYLRRLAWRHENPKSASPSRNTDERSPLFPPIFSPSPD